MKLLLNIIVWLTAMRPFQTDLLKKSDELEALKEQYNLLRKVLVQKEEVRVG